MRRQTPEERTATQIHRLWLGLDWFKPDHLSWADWSNLVIHYGFQAGRAVTTFGEPFAPLPIADEPTQPIEVGGSHAAE